MDPYLEGELWTTVHSQLAAEIARQLAPQIAPRYIARTEKRFVIVAHYWVEIRDARGRKLVTAIEILSPFNKRGQGRVEYLQKRAAILKSPAHFLEIDLLRKGRRLPMEKKLPDVEYFVFLSWAGQRPLTEVWPIGLMNPLPSVPVPLLRGDLEAVLNLQLALTNVYDSLRYDLEIDYRKPPDIPFTKAQAALAAAVRRSAVK
jgi:hypothetical protein